MVDEGCNVGLFVLHRKRKQEHRHKTEIEAHSAVYIGGVLHMAAMTCFRPRNHFQLLQLPKT